MKAADLSAGHAGRGLWAVGWRGLGARWRGFGQMLAAGADALRWGVRRGDDPRLGTSWADGCRRARWLSDRRRRGRGSNHRAPGRAPWTALRCSPPERRCFYRPPWAAWSRWPGSSRNVNVREGRAAKAHRWAPTTGAGRTGRGGDRQPRYSGRGSGSGSGGTTTPRSQSSETRPRVLSGEDQVKT